MKKKLLSIITSGLLLVGVFAGCSANKEDSSKATSASTTTEKSEVTLKVGAALTPHAEILEHIKPKLKEQGINLEIVTLDDEGQLNPALDEKQIDANYFQHVPYLESVSKEKGYDFEVAGKIHVEPIGLYSNKLKSINDLQDGDKIGIPNNPSNEYRALVLLEKNELIKLKSGLENYSATPNDIAENPKHLQFVEADVAQLPRSLGDLAGAVINTNIILDAKIDPNTAILREDGDSPYANVITVRKGDKDRKEIKALVSALTTDDVKNFIKEKYGSAVVPAF
ncbi:methionine ABC transporter substrate-binding protein [Clostridium diolis]|uniref:MetQ/NlpA family ABC transporter substrate-binding protein n=1 Tax=Clostridium diolis TaxID=223919 RepID=UPI000B3FC13C|nr:MetQ/NlpA family ABC transporter substrate-binding protein [Clostridium diolis]OVE70303.1 methionine ABC transporter substrate-binding protein [Clostridium diolis]